MSRSQYQTVFTVLFLAAIILPLTSATRLAAFPEASISNGVVQAHFYLPDAEKAYYRGTRFDWSGNLFSLTYKDHSYCEQWFDNYNATTHDAIIGPVESFAPLGYDNVKAGGKFVQIGVGVLTKLTDDKYSPFLYYPIAKTGEWKVKTSPAGIAFTHTLKDSAYSYTYTKTETLLKGKPILEITHSLTNTGKQAIETNVYNHNLFVLDKQPTGPSLSTTFSFNLTGIAEGQTGFGADNLAVTKDKTIVFNSEIPAGKHVYSLFQGFSGNAKDYDIKIENHKTGAAVRITCDRPISKLAFWGSTRIFSPEPFIDVHAAPGQTFSWKISYEFYTCAIIP